MTSTISFVECLVARCGKGCKFQQFMRDVKFTKHSVVVRYVRVVFVVYSSLLLCC